jgi:uncharacterized protein YgbK (DUF1537 family)
MGGWPTAATDPVKTVVLDDDPTGVQTIQDLYVLTRWEPAMLAEALMDERPAFFILTNTRALDGAETELLLRVIYRNLAQASRQTGVHFRIVCRGDSTLRGHYPLEMDVLASELSAAEDGGPDAHLIVPAFFESGRLTAGNVHYVTNGTTRMAVGETEFAKDPSFGYKSSHLPKWVEEKTKGRIKAGQCVCVSLEDIRQGPKRVYDCLAEASGNIPVIINAENYDDLHTVSAACRLLEAGGKRLLYRTAASFIKSFCAVPDQPLLQSYDDTAQMGQDRAVCKGGLVIVGSYVSKTTEQTSYLLKHARIEAVELDVVRLLDPAHRLQEIQRALQTTRDSLSDRSVIVYTSRRLVDEFGGSDHRSISKTISSALVHLVREITLIPRFIIAKGGITSSDIATSALNIVKARVAGQLSAGVSVWQPDQLSRFPGVPYVVFPGNVGGVSALHDVLDTLERD